MGSALQEMTKRSKRSARRYSPDLRKSPVQSPLVADRIRPPSVAKSSINFNIKCKKCESLRRELWTAQERQKKCEIEAAQKVAHYRQIHIKEREEIESLAQNMLQVNVEKQELNERNFYQNE